MSESGTPVRIGVNGCGRIGRAVLRLTEDRDDAQVVHVNDTADPASIAYLVRHDSAHRSWDRPVTAEDGALVVDGRSVPYTGAAKPTEIPWADAGVDVVLESSGRFTRIKDACDGHVAAGAPRVLLSAPPKDDDWLHNERDDAAMIVRGVNDERLTDQHTYVSTASCTTNCAAPPLKVLHDTFGVERCCLDTVHAYTASQGLVDVPHAKDPRRGRAAAVNIVPTTSGAGRAVEGVLPELRGLVEARGVRVPVVNGSLVDMVVALGREADADAINEAFRSAAADGPMRGILAVTDEPLVSSDILTDPHSAIVDLASTRVADGRLASVLVWYDNEWGTAARAVELLLAMAGGAAGSAGSGGSADAG